MQLCYLLKYLSCGAIKIPSGGKITKQIIEKEGDYVLSLKENHPTLYNQVVCAFAAEAPVFFDVETTETHDKGHGRIEVRKCRVMKNLSKIPESAQWVRMQSVIEVQRKVMEKNKETNMVSYYISSTQKTASEMLKTIRSHWAIESMHWVMDVVFREDAGRMRKDNAPANMAVVRRFVLNILNGMKEKRQTKPELMKAIGWSPEYLIGFIDKLLNYS